MLLAGMPPASEKFPPTKRVSPSLARALTQPSASMPAPRFVHAPPSQAATWDAETPPA